MSTYTLTPTPAAVTISGASIVMTGPAFTRPTARPGMILPTVPESYDAETERERNRIVIAADERNFKRGRDVSLDSERFILASANGRRWQLTVSDAGATVWTVLP